MRHMSPAELREHLADNPNPPLLLDVREPWEYDICKLPKTRLIPMRQIPQAIAGLDPQRETVVICHHGIRSRQVALFLERQGFNAVINLEGGMAAWSRDLDPEMPSY